MSCCGVGVADGRAARALAQKPLDRYIRPFVGRRRQHRRNRLKIIPVPCRRSERQGRHSGKKVEIVPIDNKGQIAGKA